MYIFYKISPWSRDLNTDFPLNNYFFRSIKLNKNAESDKYVYSGYGTGFDSRSEFSLIDGSLGKNVIIFGVDMSSSRHIDDKKRIS